MKITMRERMRRVGVLMNLATDDAEAQARFRAFLQGLQEFNSAGLSPSTYASRPGLPSTSSSFPTTRRACSPPDPSSSPPTPSPPASPLHPRTSPHPHRPP